MIFIVMLTKLVLYLISVEVICKVWFYFLEVRVKTKQLSMTIREKRKNFHFIKKSQSVKGLKLHKEQMLSVLQPPIPGSNSSLKLPRA